MIYLDNAASTRITEPILKAMFAYINGNYGNASSLHSLGRKSRQAIEYAREQVAKSINAEPNQIFFISGSTEGNNWVASNFNCILCSKVEHHSILNNPKCIAISFDSLPKTIYKQRPDLVTHMFVNNETGEIYNIKEMAKICHQMNVPFHTDSTQAFSHLPIDVKDLDVDSLVLSGHKFHSMKGTGVLYLKEPNKYKPLLYGGGQEHNLRAGTENVAGIVGIGKACEIYNYNEKTDNYILNLRTHLLKNIKNDIMNVRVNTIDKPVINNIISLSFKDVNSENLLHLLDNAGIYVSSGSACNSQNPSPNLALQELNVPPDYINGTIRISLSEENTEEEMDIVSKELKRAVEMIRITKNKEEL